MNWTGAKLKEDAFGAVMIAAGIPKETIEAWTNSTRKGYKVNDYNKWAGYSRAAMEHKVEGVPAMRTAATSVSKNESIHSLQTY